jgi:hypothetical protein
MITLKEGKILEKWSTLMEKCKGYAEGLLQAVEKNLEGHQAPGVTWKRESVAPGWLKGLFGKRRDYLLVTHERFDDYLMCVGARDYGTNLDVYWYLIGSGKSPLVRAITQISGSPLLAAFRELDVFDQQDLTAYVTVGHHSVLDSVEELMRQRNLDVGRLDRKSRGMLGIS